MKRRRLLKIAVLLVLGAIVNVAVAWGFALVFDWKALQAKGRTGTWSKLALDDMKSHWEALAPKEWEDMETGGVIEHQYCVSFVLITGQGNRPNEAPSLQRFSSGWPASAFQGWIVGSREWSAALVRGYGAVGDRVVPYIPIWPGFCINTIFYAAVLSLLFAAPFQLQRWRCIKRGLCPACGYPVGESQVCTECGKPVTIKNGLNQTG